MNGLTIEDLNIPEGATILKVVTLEDVFDEFDEFEPEPVQSIGSGLVGRLVVGVVVSVVATLTVRAITQHVVPYVKRKIAERKERNLA